MKHTLPKYLTFILIVPFLLFSSCDKKQKIKQPKNRVIVLCDASNSTTKLNSKDSTNGRLNKLKEYVKKIPKWYPFESMIYYYPVSDNLLSQQLGKTICYDVKKTSQLQDEKEKVDLLTNNLSEEMDHLASVTRNSCILLSIQRAIKVLHELKNGNDPYENDLIIISDMLEYSNSNETGFINLNKIDLNELDKEVERFNQENPSIDVSDLNLKVRIIINSPGMTKRYEKIQEIWEKWFFKIGVRKENLFFYTSEPSMKENPLLNKF